MELKHSDRWFSAFCRWYRIALRKTTHTAQKLPADKITKVKEFHQYLNYIHRCGKYELCDIANMDQTPLPFILDDGTTYEHHGSKDVCCKTGASGVEKRQATAQITIFANGVPRFKPLIIFRGKGLRISTNEKKACDSRVTVFFQENAWCDEEIIVKWINSKWNYFFLNPSTPASDGIILVADIHRAQQTENVKRLLARCRTKLVNIPGGCTSLLQPVDVLFKGPFKAHVRAMSEKHLNKNIHKYTDGKIFTSEHRILMTKWVVEAQTKTWSKEVLKNMEFL